MAATSRTVTVTKPVATVAEYLSDFTHTAEWDPHTVSCRRLDAGPIAVGARYENVQRLGGRESALVYEVVEYQPGSRIVLEGGSDTVHSRDEMIFEQVDATRTTVTYHIDVHLSGVLTPAELLAPVVLNRLADEGATGLRERLEQL